jgi:ketosteroid isomerase-like protein
MHTKLAQEALAQMCREGRMFDMLDQYYAEKCVFQEADGSIRKGREAQRKHLQSFFATLKKFNGAKLHGAVGADNLDMCEWTFDMVGPDGGPIIWNEVIVRRWANGKVVAERFYTSK